MKKVLVTGATGFLGQKLTYRLHSLGYEVTASGRNKTIGEKLKNSGISFHACDLSDKEQTIDIAKNHDFVFHTAALSSPWGKYNDFYLANVESTKNIIDSCKLHKIERLIHVSTPSIYFNHDERFDVKESDSLPHTFVNDYAKTKFLAEKEIDRAFKEGLNVITIRPRALFGPDDTTIIPRLIRANEKRFIPIIGDGKVLTDITYVENVVDALLLCMNSKSNTLGEKYNITNGEPVYLIDLLHSLFDELNVPFRKKHISFKSAHRLAGLIETYHKTFLPKKEPVLTKYSVSVLGKSQTLSIEKAKNELGYTPNIPLEEGIKQFVSWWKETENG